MPFVPETCNRVRLLCKSGHQKFKLKPHIRSRTLHTEKFDSVKFRLKRGQQHINEFPLFEFWAWVEFISRLMKNVQIVSFEKDVFFFLGM